MLQLEDESTALTRQTASLCSVHMSPLLSSPARIPYLPPSPNFWSSSFLPSLTCPIYAVAATIILTIISITPSVIFIIYQPGFCFDTGPILPPKDLFPVGLPRIHMAQFIRSVREDDRTQNGHRPSEIGHWCASIPPGDFPPTPPDSASDCAHSDCTDMYPSWISSVPEDQWLSNPTSEQDAAHPLTAQDLSALDTSSWFNIADGSVARGLSPVLSYECENGHNLNSMPELDVAVLPPSLDLSFVSEPWNSGHLNGSSIYYPMHANGYTPAGIGMMSQPRAESHMYPAAPQSVFPGAQQSVYNPHAIQSAFPGGIMSNGFATAAAAPHRVLLPWTQMPEAAASQQVQGLPHMVPGRAPNLRSIQPTVATVSNMSAQPQGISAARPGSPHGREPLSYVPLDHSQGPNLPFVPGQPLNMPGLSKETNTYPDPSMEELGALFHFDGTDSSSSPRASSYVNGIPGVVVTARTAARRQELPGVVEASTSSSAHEQDSKTATLAGEGEEGRHRSHALYSIGPWKDGLYHCPYEKESNCQHKPTKLKCNYDKFIDSHIKPFRCKIEMCSKQEFSSTACLLRHEREAHGMHGHGDRPHLCWYEGCERSAAGSGFPRRYNLFDHMKRVHDHKENGPEQSQSPVAAESNKKVSSRKRKAASPHVAQPAPQRAKSTIAPPQQQSMAIQPQVYRGPSIQDTDVKSHSISKPELQTRKQPNLQLGHTQWIQRRDLFAREMDHARSPADLARLSQEFRRLSEE
nr:hypothetical protein CFP56_56910 [Quercus suber]